MRVSVSPSLFNKEKKIQYLRIVSRKSKFIYFSGLDEEIICNIKSREGLRFTFPLV